MLQIIFLCLVGRALADLDLSTFIIFTVLTEPHHEKTYFITGVISFSLPVLSTKPINYQDIMLTCPCNVHPLTPHIYIVKLGLTGVYIFCLFLL